MEGVHLGNLGIAYQVGGQIEPSIEALQQSIVVCRELGDRRLEAIAISNLGEVYLKLQRYEEAEVALRKAILVGEETYPVLSGAARSSLALLIAQRGQRWMKRLSFSRLESLSEYHPEEHGTRKKRQSPPRW